MRLVGYILDQMLDHMLDYMIDYLLDHMLDHIILGLVTTELQYNCNINSHYVKKMLKITKAKKLVLVLTTSILVTGISKEIQIDKEVILNQVSYIHYSVQF